MDLAERIKFVIKESGLNQKQFAERINVSDGFVSKLLKGACKISNTTAIAIETEFGFSKYWLLEGKGPKLKEKKELKPIQKSIIYDVENILTEEELKALYAYIEVQKKMKSEKDINV